MIMMISMLITKGLLLIISLVTLSNSNPTSTQSLIELTYEKNANISNDSNTNKITLPIGTQLNILCALKNPQYGYYLNITKKSVTQGTNTASSSEVLQQFVEPSFFQGYQLGVSYKNNSRFSLQTIEFPNISVIGSIKNAQLSDNGKYRCVLSQRNQVLVERELDVIVYKPLELNQMSLNAKFNTNNTNVPHEHGKLNLALGHTYRLICSLHDVYPKPSVHVSLSENEQVTHEDVHMARDVSSVVHMYHRVIHSFNYTTKREDHEMDLVCNATSNMKGDRLLSKKSRVEVQGFEVIESECRQQVVIGQEDGNALVTCDFYSVPKADIKWLLNNSDIDETNEYDDTMALRPISNLEYLSKGIYRASLKFSSDLKLTSTDALPVITLVLTHKDSSTTNISFTLTSKINAHLNSKQSGTSSSASLRAIAHVSLMLLSAFFTQIF